jgi:hypothetical protein
LNKLNKLSLSFASITFAQKARRILNGNGVFAELIKFDAQKSSTGCTYGLKIDHKNYLNAIGLLKEHGIPYSTLK